MFSGVAHSVSNFAGWLDLDRNSISGVPSEIVSLTNLSESIFCCCTVATACMVEF